MSAAAAWAVQNNRKSQDGTASESFTKGQRSVDLPPPATEAKKGGGGGGGGGDAHYCCAPGFVALPHREKVHAFYNTHVIQWTVATVILFNFFAIVVEKEIDPYPTEYQRFAAVWEVIDKFCNWIFLIEIIINIYGNFFRPFLGDPWNYLDLMVVIIGMFSILNIDLGPLRQIKILRALRILRLFKRVKSLNKILVALIKSIPGVLNAFIVMLIFMMIFAIIAVDVFRDFGAGGTYTTTQTYGVSDATWGQGEGMAWSRGLPYVHNQTEVSSMTLRGYHYGQEYFGTFFRSLYTLFQVLTGESWSEAVVRPLLFGHDPSLSWAVGGFFTLYILVTQVVLQNVVVAVLLDKFVTDPDVEAAGEEEPAEATAAAAATDSARQKLSARRRVEAAKLQTSLDLAKVPPPAVSDGPPGVDGGVSGGGSGSYRDLVAVREDMLRMMAEQRRLAAMMEAMLQRLPTPELAA